MSISNTSLWVGVHGLGTPLRLYTFFPIGTRTKNVQAGAPDRLQPKSETKKQEGKIKEKKKKKKIKRKKVQQF